MSSEYPLILVSVFFFLKSLLIPGLVLQALRSPGAIALPYGLAVLFCRAWCS